MNSDDAVSYSFVTAWTTGNHHEIDLYASDSIENTHILEFPITTLLVLSATSLESISCFLAFQISLMTLLVTLPPKDPAPPFPRRREGSNASSMKVRIDEVGTSGGRRVRTVGLSSEVLCRAISSSAGIKRDVWVTVEEGEELGMGGGGVSTRYILRSLWKMPLGPGSGFV